MKGYPNLDDPLFLSNNHCIYQLHTSALVDELRQLVTPKEEVVANNTRTDTHVQNTALKTHIISEVSNMLTHYLAPELWQLTLGNLACHVWSFEELLEDISN